MKGQTAAMEIPAIPVEEGVRLMAGDLERGRRFDKAVLLFAVYRAETTRAQAEALLEVSLWEMGFRIERVRFPLAEEPDWPYRLRFHPPDGDTAFFVYDLRKAFPEILQYLNYRREVFAEERVRTVFWVLEEEARRLALEAPDFWAFRTQVLELLEVPPPKERAEIAKELAWWGFGTAPYISSEEIRDGITFRERLLAELAETKETLAARADIMCSLGAHDCFIGEYEKALFYLQQALDLAQKIEGRPMAAWIWIMLSKVYHRLGYKEKAATAFLKAIELYPRLAYHVSPPSPTPKPSKPSALERARPSNVFKYALILVSAIILPLSAFTIVWSIAPSGFDKIVSATIRTELIIVGTTLALVGIVRGKEIIDFLARMLGRTSASLTL